MTNIKEFAKKLLQEKANVRGTYIDFTMGGGRDTLFLAQLAPMGKIYSFDIQAAALEQTKTLLQQHACQVQVSFIQDSHSHLLQYVQSPIDGGIFNLGYLPGGAAEITTHSDTTLQALSAGLSLLKPGGRIVIVVYTGHPEGCKESEELKRYCRSLNENFYTVLRYSFENKNNPPYLIAIEKSKYYK